MLVMGLVLKSSLPCVHVDYRRSLDVLSAVPSEPVAVAVETGASPSAEKKS